MLPKVRAFPSASQQDMAIVIEFRKGRAFGGFVHGMARGERTAQGSCFQAAELGLAMGIYSSQKRRRKKGSGHSVFFRKNNHSNNSLRSCTYSWGRKLLKVGTGSKQRVSKGSTAHWSFLSAQQPAHLSLPRRVWYLVFGLVCWGGVLFFSAFQMRAAQPDKRVAQAQAKCACP